MGDEDAGGSSTATTTSLAVFSARGCCGTGRCVTRHMVVVAMQMLERNETSEFGFYRVKFALVNGASMMEGFSVHDDGRIMACFGLE